MPEVKEIVFEDDTFTGNRVFAREVARLVKEKGVTIPWFANIRTNTDRETLAALREAGLRCCATGFESGDDLLLKNMWKGQSTAASKKFIKNAQELGILVHGCFMVGFPGETKQTMRKTLDLALDLSPDSAQFYPVMPFPGTSYYKWAKDNGYLATVDFRDWLNDEGGHRTVLNLPGLSAKDMDEFCEMAVRRFHFRPKYMWFKLKQAFREPREGIRSVKSFVFFLGYLFSKRRRIAGPFPVSMIPAKADWYKLHEMPLGRMQTQSRQLSRRKADGEAGQVVLQSPSV